MSFVVFPLYFLSGALFPLEKLPTWLSIITLIDPATYAVEALRFSILGVPGSRPFSLDMIILLTSSMILGIVGIWSFRRMKAV